MKMLNRLVKLILVSMVMSIMMAHCLEANDQGLLEIPLGIESGMHDNTGVKVSVRNTASLK